MFEKNERFSFECKLDLNCSCLACFSFDGVIFLCFFISRLPSSLILSFFLFFLVMFEFNFFIYVY